MDRSYRDLLKHSGIYALGHMLGRLASVVLLPVYTRYLSPADYGVLAIVDLVAALLGIVLASGTVRAVTRHHFEADTERERDGLWWTGLLLLVATVVVLLAPALLLRRPIAVWTLGPGQPAGSFYFLLALATLGLTTVDQLLQAHLRVYKRSTLFVVISLGRLLLNIALNLWLLIGLRLGLVAILWGNLLAGGVALAVLFGTFVRVRGAPSLRPDLLGRLVSYGTPLIVASLLAAAMHQLDRYLLRLLLTLEEVGIYSVAYQIGQGINTLLLAPFAQIWFIVVYEIHGTPGAERVFVRVFRHFFILLSLIMLGVSFAAVPLLRLLVAPEFRSAAGLVPLVCLAYLFFSLHSHFNVPPLVAKRTPLVIPAHAVGVLVNVAANLLLIPVLGVYGAAWASVVTFAAFSFSGLALYRRIESYDYPLAGGAAVLAGMAASFLGWRLVASWSERPLSTALLAALLWGVWAVALSRPLWRRLRDGTLLADLLPGRGGRGGAATGTGVERPGSAG